MTQKTTITCDGCGVVNPEHGVVSLYGLDIATLLHACQRCWPRMRDALYQERSPTVADLHEQLDAALADVRRKDEALKEAVRAMHAASGRAESYEAAFRKQDEYKKTIAELRKQYSAQDSQLRAANDAYEALTAAFQTTVDDLVRMLGRKRRRKNREYPAIAARLATLGEA